MKKITGLFAAGAIAASLAACGGTQHHSAGAGSAAPAPATAVYLGPPCSQMDASNSAGYSMCDSQGSACPTGWQDFRGVTGACEPMPTDTSTTTDTPTTTDAVPATSTTTTDSASSTTSDYSSSYPSLFENQFASSCISAGGSYAHCTCALRRIEASVDYPTVVAAEHDIATGNPPDWYVQAAQDCPA